MWPVVNYTKKNISSLILMQSPHLFSTARLIRTTPIVSIINGEAHLKPKGRGKEKQKSSYKVENTKTKFKICDASDIILWLKNIYNIYIYL